MLQTSLDIINANVVALGSYVFDANKRIYWLYIVSAILLAIPVFALTSEQKSVKHFFRFLFPRSVYGAKSARHDYVLFFINPLIKTLIYAPAIVTMVPIALATTELLEWLFGHPLSLDWSNTSVIIWFTVALFIFDDFTRFLLHYLLHKVPFLWAFHQVHHSARVLTPMTIYRSHPIESYLYACRMAVTQGVVVGLGYHVFGTSLQMADILGANVFVFAFNVLGANLRHSHIWLSWGDRIENWFISPAQHQIHHSNQVKHFDSNLGSALAIWDRMFATHIKASAADKIEFGVGKYFTGHQSLLSLYLSPFLHALPHSWQQKLLRKYHR